MTTTKIKCSEIVIDFDIYPRHSVDGQHISYIVQAMQSAAQLPPIIVDQKTKRVVDGVHRLRAHVRINGEDSEIAVILKKYASDKELYLDAMRLNAAHGRNLTSFDRAHAILIADRLHILRHDTAAALQLTMDAVGELHSAHTATLELNGPLPIKRTIQHMSGKMLTKKQAEAIPRIGGMNQLFYVNQILLLIESDLLDKGNGQLMDSLRNLHSMLGDVLRRKKTA